MNTIDPVESILDKIEILAFNIGSHQIDENISKKDLLSFILCDREKSNEIINELFQLRDEIHNSINKLIDYFVEESQVPKNTSMDKHETRTYQCSPDYFNFLEKMTFGTPMIQIDDLHLEYKGCVKDMDELLTSTEVFHVEEGHVYSMEIAEDVYVQYVAINDSGRISFIMLFDTAK